MKRIQLQFSLIKALLLCLAVIAKAQLAAPEAEAVYGGRVNAITGYSLNADSSRIFIATESANSAFYADVYANTSVPRFGQFQPMPGLNAAAGYGSAIRAIAAHAPSGRLFVAHDTGLLSTHPNSSAVDPAHPHHVNALLILEDFIFFTQGQDLHYGTLDATGSYTPGSGSPLNISPLGGQGSLGVSPVDSSFYLFSENGGAPGLFKLSDNYDTLSGSTTYSDISPSAGVLTPSSSSTSPRWRAFGIGPDGRLFFGGSDSANKCIAYSDDDVTWVPYSTGLSGVAGDVCAFAGDASAYHMFFSKGWNAGNGLGSWSEFGNPGGFETHPNDGTVFTDPTNDNIVYMTTDQGLGASIDRGATIFEINAGIEAVQVTGWDQTADKNTAWLAAKSGIRKVSNYLGNQHWTNAIFPMGDGSPYYSAEMVPGDTNHVFVGNVRVYHTTDGGNTWNRAFSPENPPFNLPGVGTKALAIEVLDYDHNVVFAGFEIQGPDHGGLFYSNDGGANWDQILVEASATGQDVDVFDIDFNVQGGDTVAYIGVEYDLSSPQGYGVYKLTKNGSVWTVGKEFDGSYTSTGSVIAASILDVEVTVSGDTVLAAGTDAGVNHPIVYYKPLNTTGLWTPLTTSGFPFATGKEATAVTVGRDTVYAAVDNEIYFLPFGSASWTLGHAYPVGTRVNFLYFDDLLVGTDTGLYQHPSNGVISSVRQSEKAAVPELYRLAQNYPNPFNPTTTIQYTLVKGQTVEIKVFDILGREMATMVSGFREAGSHSVTFDASHLANGVYFYSIRAEGFSKTRKMILME
jgi:hypothetical protein